MINREVRIFRRFDGVLVWLLVGGGGSMLCGAVLGLLAALIGSGRMTIYATAGLCIVPAIISTYVAKWLRLPGEVLLGIGAAIAGLLAAYGFLVVRLSALYDWAVVPWTIGQLHALWPDPAGKWVAVNTITGEQRTAGYGDVSLLRMGLTAAPIVAALFNPLVAFLVQLKWGAFCYRCDRWLDEPTERFAFKRIGFGGGVRTRLQRGDWSVLDVLKPVALTERDYLELGVYVCADCGRTMYLSAWDCRNMTAPPEQRMRGVIVRRVLINEETLRRLRERYAVTKPAAN